MTRTSYKVFEKTYNNTDSISFPYNGSRRLNPNAEYDIVALHPIRAKLLGIKPGQKLGFIMPNGKIVYRTYHDTMAYHGKWDNINWERCDFLVGKNDKDLKHEVIMIL
jgi:hypothetical protein